MTTTSNQDSKRRESSVQDPGRSLSTHESNAGAESAPTSTLSRIALAGGGTGGHLLPGIHVLETALESSQVRIEDVLWFSSGRAVEEAVFQPFIERLGLRAAAPHFLRVPLALESAGGGAPARIALGLRSLPAVRRARAALVTSGSEVLLGLGGFTTLPAVLAARSLGIPTALLEINAKSGTATRWLAPLAARVFHAWRGTMPSRGERSARAGARHVWTGPPLSPAFRAAPATEETRRDAKRYLGLDPQRPLLAILGGSQGAGGLNQFISQHIRIFLEADLQIVHQVGPGRQSEAAPHGGASYRALEFVDDVAVLLDAADLVLARGGASTLAEVAARRVPTVVVPYPHHADRHQECNARELGSGVRLALESNLSASSASEMARLAGPAGRAERLRMSAELAERLPEPDSAGRILDELIRLPRKHRQMARKHKLVDKSEDSSQSSTS